MRVGAIVCFVLAGLTAISAFRTATGGNRPDDATRVVLDRLPRPPLEFSPRPLRFLLFRLVATMSRTGQTTHAVFTW